MKLCVIVYLTLGPNGYNVIPVAFQIRRQFVGKGLLCSIREEQEKYRSSNAFGKDRRLEPTN
jgi:hypothetical protein